MTVTRVRQEPAAFYGTEATITLLVGGCVPARYTFPAHNKCVHSNKDCTTKKRHVAVAASVVY